ncbi:MAG: prolyl oligopeptidase family serine peptidase [Bacillota bacterium]
MNKVYRSYAVGFSLPLILAAIVCAQQPQAKPGQQAQRLEKQVAVKLDYLLYLPEAYDKDSAKKWPLILFLHGAGERGSDVNKVKVHGVPKIVEGKKDFPFIVVSPQCPEDRWWEPFELNALLDEIMASYRVDADRVYLTGLSMGGFGTWDLAMRSPGRFAAIAPICGGGNPVMAFRIKDIPAWVFHGEADPVVPLQRSVEMVEALKKVKADVKFTTYPGVGHDSWTQTYENPELYTWFLSHRRGEKAAASGSR